METKELVKEATVNSVVTRETIAHDFGVRMSGILAPDVIQSAKNNIITTPKACHANGSAMSMIFYLQFTVQISDSNEKKYNRYQFKGNGGGVSTPGGGALMGDIYTDNLEFLINNTKSFEFNCALAYTSIVFFDNKSRCLGSFQSGSVSTVAGIGGGKGKWSK